MKLLRSLSTFALMVLAFAQTTPAQKAEASASPLQFGEAAVALSGPWKFHTGDDPRWENPNFDDSSWQDVDLASNSTTHDPDVGLTGYVGGWTSRGYPGYCGYAWYRIHVLLPATSAQALTLAGPPDVDDAYQIYFDGKLLGGVGDFAGKTPVAYGIQPETFAVPSVIPSADSSARPAVIAVRVWMSRLTLDSTAEAGGIHIAPTIGKTSEIEARYRLQWLELIRGYFLEILQAAVFVLLAIMSCCLLLFDRSDSAYAWLAAALVLTGMVRANLAIASWTQWESLQAFDLVANVVLIPLLFGTWTLAWYSWFRLQKLTWLPKITGALTTVYLLWQWLLHIFASLDGPVPFVGAATIITTAFRLAFGFLLLFIAYRAIAQYGRRSWLGLLAMLLVSTGLFASELSALHIPGIWFPFGTGVSRTQFAYAAVNVVLFLVLFHRLAWFAKRLQVDMHSEFA